MSGKFGLDTALYRRFATPPFEIRGSWDGLIRYPAHGFLFAPH